jgi:hypothetical protein
MEERISCSCGDIASQYFIITENRRESTATHLVRKHSDILVFTAAALVVTLLTTFQHLDRTEERMASVFFKFSPI